MKKLALFLLSLFFLFSSCDVLMQALETASTTSSAPSESEVVQGLKKALEIGAQYAAEQLHKKDGYFGNAAVKILLPPEVQNVVNTAINNPTVKRLGLDRVLKKKVDQVVLAVNRSAEAAAIEAKPIFVNAIRSMTIVDAYNILKGQDIYHKTQGFDSLAATHYLEYKTRPQLFNLYKPKIEAALNRDLGLGFSANQAWNTAIKYYNNYVARILGKPRINYTLTDYATNKALDGLFYMVGQQEKKIRKDPYKWGSDIISRVFGYVRNSMR